MCRRSSCRPIFDLVAEKKQQQNQQKPNEIGVCVRDGGDDSDVDDNDRE